MGIRLSADEAWELIAQSHTGILTTLRANGSPVTLPTWFAVLDRTICLFTPSGTKKVLRIRRDPRASFLVESGERWAELRAVHVSGHVEIVEDADAKARITQALDEKYAAFRSANQMSQATTDYYANRTFLRLVPEPRMLTWDNSRLIVGEPG
jgi:PPOX class probable F420-dependent enzyme